MYNGAQNRPPTRPRQMLEYPGVPPPKPPRFIDRTLRPPSSLLLRTFSQFLSRQSDPSVDVLRGHPGVGGVLKLVQMRPC